MAASRHQGRFGVPGQRHDGVDRQVEAQRLPELRGEAGHKRRALLQTGRAGGGAGGAGRAGPVLACAKAVSPAGQSSGQEGVESVSWRLSVEIVDGSCISGFIFSVYLFNVYIKFLDQIDPPSIKIIDTI